MERIEYGDWEYHPAYGIYSRTVYRIIGSGKLRYCGREYAPMNYFNVMELSR